MTMKPQHGTIDPTPPPVMAVVAGLPGSGKTTLLDQLRTEAGFPQHMVFDRPEAMVAFDAAMTHAIALQQPVAVETSCASAALVLWMHKAMERHYAIELIILGGDDELVRQRRARRQSRREVLEAYRRMASAVDAARRVLLIDNSSGAPFIAATIDSGKVSVLDHNPVWVARRILGPRLARAASLKAIRSSYERIAANSLAHPVLQQAGRGAASYTGKIAAVSEYHALQQVSEALHVIHDLSLLSNGGLGLALDVASTLAYGLPDLQPTASRILQRHDLAQDR